MEANNLIREHLLYLLNGDGAHLDFEAAVKDLPPTQRGTKPKGAAHSAWELLEHLRITQRDVLESIRNPNHTSPEFPDGYWPGVQKPSDDKTWEASTAAFRTDSAELRKMVENNGTDLLAELPHAAGQTMFRKLAMLADHNSYHIGQLVLLRRILGAWQ